MDIEMMKNNLKQSIDEVFSVIYKLSEDQITLKLKAYQPSALEAKVFLDYFSWEEGSAKQNFEVFYSKDLQILDEWLEIFCLLSNCTREEALSRVIDGVI